MRGRAYLQPKRHQLQRTSRLLQNITCTITIDNQKLSTQPSKILDNQIIWEETLQFNQLYDSMQVHLKELDDG